VRIRGGAIGAGLAAVAAGLLLALPGTASAQGPATSGDFAGLVTIPSGRQLYLECHGTGSPTVIFEAGLRGRGDFWLYSADGGFGSGPFAKVASSTRACFYDRPGTLLGPSAVSRSTPVPMPRSTGEAATDLHDLLGTAGVAPPYVLVGSSTGGLIARQFTAGYPLDVAGLVLVDAISEFVQKLMKPGQFARYDAAYLQTVNNPEVAEYPDLEQIDFYRSFAEMRVRPRPPRQIPILVLSSDYGFGMPGGIWPGFARLVNVAWKRAQIRLTTLEPGVKRVIAYGSGHQISLNEPGLVARMTLRVVKAVQSGKHNLGPIPRPRRDKR
jgi:pimeloyl-ACP methyl ester carboxylesterase